MYSQDVQKSRAQKGCSQVICAMSSEPSPLTKLRQRGYYILAHQSKEHSPCRIKCALHAGLAARRHRCTRTKKRLTGCFMTEGFDVGWQAGAQKCICRPLCARELGTRVYQSSSTHTSLSANDTLQARGRGWSWTCAARYTLRSLRNP